MPVSMHFHGIPLLYEKLCNCRYAVTRIDSIVVNNQKNTFSIGKRTEIIDFQLLQHKSKHFCETDHKCFKNSSNIFS